MKGNNLNRVKRSFNSNYTQLPNQVSRDSNLSWKARGIFSYLIGNDDSWRFSMANIMEMSKSDGMTSLRSGIKELEEQGYLKRTPSRNETGFNGMVWELLLPSETEGGIEDVRGIGNIDDRESTSKVTRTALRTSSSKNTIIKENNKYNNSVNVIFDAYPLNCSMKNRRLKYPNDKDAIINALIDNTESELLNAIELYVADCKGKVYLKNLSTFLKNIPDMEDNDIIKEPIVAKEILQ